MARAKLLNVKKHLERVEATVQDMLKHNHEFPNNGGLRMPPAFVDELRSISFITRAILRKHAEKNTRKDVYLPR